MRRVALAGLAGVAVCGGAFAADAVAEGESITYTRHIAPMIQEKCQECHRPQGLAPFSLMNYRQVKGWSKMIKEVVNEGRMPPWGLDPNVGKWANDPSFSKEELATLNAWVDGGMAQGDPADMPAAREFFDDWTIGEPELVLEMPEEVIIPPTGVMPYQHYVTELDFTEDTYLKAIEVRPGNMKVVHHIIIFVQEPDAPRDEKGSFVNGMLDVYAPGSPPGVMPEGVVRMIPKGSKLVWQVHYTPTGKEEKDRSKLGLVFADGPIKEVVRTATVVNAGFEIPPHAEHHVVEASMTFPSEAKIYSFTPHMHYRGTAMDFILTYPDGREQLACSIPKYDFNWQLDYKLEEPLIVPKGTKVKVVGVFDNSENNPYNPDPNKAVRWGEQTWEEMLMGGIFLSWTDGEVREAVTVSSD